MEDVQDTGDGVETSRLQPSGLLADFGPSNTPELSRHSLRSFAFAEPGVSVPHIEPNPIEEQLMSPRVERVDLPRGPPEICDANTIFLVEATIPQSTNTWRVLNLYKDKVSFALLERLCDRAC
jgi:hypothetical protein